MQHSTRTATARPLLMLSVLAGLLLFMSGSSYAQKHGEVFSQLELRSLPRVCLAQSGVNRRLESPVVPAVERDEWAAKMGPGYQHLHHYCWGLLQLRRSTAMPDERRRRASYRAAIEGFDYVLRNVSARFPLKPEVYLRKGMALRLNGEVARSASEYMKAIRIKKDYTPAYAALIEIHTDLGDWTSAREVLDIGLHYAPNSKILAKKKAEIDRALGEQ